VVFTASHACYANPVIDYLDPDGTLVAKRLFRENCRQVSESLYVKDLTVIKNRQMKNLVLVDNAAYSYALQLDNGVPVIPFYNNKKDWTM
jgi:CTD small phosphatase-like protein 2